MCKERKAADCFSCQKMCTYLFWSRARYALCISTFVSCSTVITWRAFLARINRQSKTCKQMRNSLQKLQLTFDTCKQHNMVQMRWDWVSNGCPNNFSWDVKMGMVLESHKTSQLLIVNCTRRCTSKLNERKVRCLQNFWRLIDQKVALNIFSFYHASYVIFWMATDFLNNFSQMASADGQNQINGIMKFTYVSNGRNLPFLLQHDQPPRPSIVNYWMDKRFIINHR